MDERTRKVMHSSKKTGGKDHWCTPQYFFERLNKVFNFTLDPAASSENAKCKNFFTEEDDGLSKDWAGHTVFVNPPYSQAKKWIEKGYREGQKENTTVVMLVASRTDTQAFHNYIMNSSQVFFVKGRLVFEIDGKPVLDKNGNPQGAPFPSLVVVFRKTRKLFPEFSMLKGK